MDLIRKVQIEKLTDLLPTYRYSADNHTYDSCVLGFDTIREVELWCDSRDYQWQGITYPPYAPYSSGFYYLAFVIFDLINEEEYWFHVPAFWVNNLREELGLDRCFKERK